MAITTQEIQCFYNYEVLLGKEAKLNSKGIQRYTPCCPQFEAEANMDIDLLLSYFTPSLNILLPILNRAPYRK